jgi:hypothetical protein
MQSCNRFFVKNSARRLHSVYVNVYIHYFIFKNLSYQYVAHFKMFYKTYKTHKKYKCYINVNAEHW